MTLKIENLYWKDNVIEKIMQKHGVTREEVEEVIWESQPEVRKHFENRYLINGQTLDGRYLLIVLDIESKNVFVPVTARDMKKSEKSAFKRGRRKKH